MSIAKLQAKLRRMEKDHVRANNLDFVAMSRGKMDDATLDHRAEGRRIQREELLHEIADWQDDCDRDERRERQERRRVRWHGYAYAAMRALPYYRGKPLTEGQRAVLTALGAASKGQQSFEVAHDWLAKKSGVSVDTVKRTIRRLDAEGLLHRQVRQIRGKAMNLWNRYRWTCEKLAQWASALFSNLGGQASPTPPKGDSSSATEGEQDELDLTADGGASPCRQKALRHDQGGKFGELRKRSRLTTGLDVGVDFAVVARAAMRELGHELADDLGPEDVADAVESLKLELQPGFKPFFWNKAIWAHGRATALMAFLECRLVRDMRRTSIPDSRPWNEREPIRNANAYLWGILKNKPGECRPEITVCAKLDRGGVYTLPPALLDLTRNHMTARKDLHRHVSSAG